MQTIAVINLKGGTGKTSTCFHLGGMLARRGSRVLLVDNDPQASLSQGIWGPEACEGLDPAVTIVAAYAGHPSAKLLVHPTGFEDLWLLPGHELADEWNMLPKAQWGELPLAIHEVLVDLRDDFDVCLIDCSPNLYMLSFAALLAADSVIVPMQAEDYGAQGVRRVNRAILTVQDVRPGSPGMLGYLITMIDRRQGVHRVFEKVIRERYGEQVFATAMPAATDFRQAVTMRTPISHYATSGNAWKATVALAVEAERRLVGAANGETKEVVA